MLAQQVEEAITAVVQELVKLRASFTGEDVYKRMANKFVRRAVDYKGLAATVSASVVSAFVRQLFNGKFPGFAGYGSTTVQCLGGPLLYFPLPSHAKQKAERIRAVIEASQSAINSSGMAQLT